MNSDITAKLFIIESKILRKDYIAEAKDVKNWGGADVVIEHENSSEIEKWLEDDSVVISAEEYQPRKRAVITEHAKELSWLFYQFRDTLSNYIAFSNKYVLYGRLAYYAEMYLSKHPDEKDPGALLKNVLGNMKSFLENAYSEN